MTGHYWGDGFDFYGLEKAASWIDTFYRRSTKQHITWKEKYGTIRYECVPMYVKNTRHCYILCEIMRRATLKFPQFKAELVDDWNTSLQDVPNLSRNLLWYKGYFDGIASGWWPKTRPYKPYKRDDHSKYKNPNRDE